jgi:exopolyphosphatase / guanosine-5'-triphosphate,3'-diphosphate pyrophosphatase
VAGLPDEERASPPRQEHGPRTAAAPNAPHPESFKSHNGSAGSTQANGYRFGATHAGGVAGREALDRERQEVYGALDLGTNNCRLLLARPSRRGFRVVDAFSRIIRLGEGVSQTGRLSDAAMGRTIDALKVCAGKLSRNSVARARCVATEACRIAENGQEFLHRVASETGIRIELLDREAEAHLAVSGCASLIDHRADYVLVFDIGGGSSELIWLDLKRSRARGGGPERFDVKTDIAAWTSLPVGVVTLAERFGGHHVTAESFEAMVAYVTGLIAPFEAANNFRPRTAAANIHLLGTSGTVTTVAGIQLGLRRYDRARVDGCWLDVAAARDVTYGLLARSYEERVAEPCIGHERADLVLAGCAILEALLRMWPAQRLRVADRGLREGILTTLMGEDGVYRAGRRRRRRQNPGR